MGRRPKPLNPDDPLHAFAIELKALRDAAGLAGMAKATCDRVGVNRATYYAWLSGKQLPGRDVLELTVRAWGGDPAYWLTRRREVEAALSKATVLRLQMTRAQGTQNSTTQDNNSPMRTRKIRRISEIPVSSHFDALRSQRIDDARQALGKMGFDSARSSERSAYVLLSLLNLKPEQEWKNAQMPILRLTEMMEWIHEEYKRAYAPNTQKMMRSLIIRGLLILA